MFFFFNDTATTEIYTLSLHDALPIFGLFCSTPGVALARAVPRKAAMEMLLLGEMVPAAEAHRIGLVNRVVPRSEEHMSELQSRQYLVCRLLLEKKKQTKSTISTIYGE